MRLDVSAAFNAHRILKKQVPVPVKEWTHPSDRGREAELECPFLGHF